MIGVILITLGTFFEEISLSFGKWEFLHNKENIYTFGFLNFFWLFIIFVVMAIYKNSFIFDVASIPIVIVFILFEILQSYLSLNALAKSDRSTSGFLMIITIPIILVIDIFLGYKIGVWGILGIATIVISLILLLLNHGITRKGITYVLLSAINASITISIFKYCITHYNSIEAQQIVTIAFLLIYLFIMSMWKFKVNPFVYLFKKEFFIQSILMGAGGVFVSVAYIYAPASIITSGKRAFAVLWSMLAGNKVFHEGHIIVKILASVLIILGLIFLVL